MTDDVDYGRIAYDRQEVADVLYRYAAGLDHGDADVLASAFADDVVVDLTQLARRLGRELPVMKGCEAVVARLIPMVGEMDTSHTVSNVRVALHGDTATLQAYLMAQHYLPGRGPAPQDNRHSLFMNRYDAALVRDGTQWRFTRLTVDNAWFDGTLDIIDHHTAALGQTLGG